MNAFEEFLKKSRVIVLWAKYDERHSNFKEQIPESADAIEAMHCCESVEMFYQYWCAIRDCPEDMWYWVISIEDGEMHCICSGACDPADDEIFADWFGEEFDELL